MTKKEQNEIMRLVGQIEGMCKMMFVDGDEDTSYVRNNLLEIAQDLEAIVKGYDHYDILPLPSLTRQTSPPLEGGDEDDV